MCISIHLLSSIDVRISVPRYEVSLTEGWSQLCDAYAGATVLRQVLRHVLEHKVRSAQRDDGGGRRAPVVSDGWDPTSKLCYARVVILADPPRLGKRKCVASDLVMTQPFRNLSNLTVFC